MKKGPTLLALARAAGLLTPVAAAAAPTSVSASDASSGAFHTIAHAIAQLGNQPTGTWAGSAAGTLSSPAAASRIVQDVSILAGNSPAPSSSYPTFSGGITDTSVATTSATALGASAFAPGTVSNSGALGTTTRSGSFGAYSGAHAGPLSSGANSGTISTAPVSTSSRTSALRTSAGSETATPATAFGGSSTNTHTSASPLGAGAATGTATVGANGQATVTTTTAHSQALGAKATSVIRTPESLCGTLAAASPVGSRAVSVSDPCGATASPTPSPVPPAPNPVPPTPSPTPSPIHGTPRHSASDHHPGVTIRSMHPHASNVPGATNPVTGLPFAALDVGGVLLILGGGAMTLYRRRLG